MLLTEKDITSPVNRTRATALHEQLVITPHHPDRLRRPEARPGLIAEERFSQALLWNVFRTFELVTPSFWLRRLHARLFEEALVPAPQIARIHLWKALGPPPAERLDGVSPDVIVDVLIETEHAIVSLIAHDRADRWDADDRISKVIAAGGWRAGTRRHYAGVIARASTQPPLDDWLQARYARSSQSGALRGRRQLPEPAARVRLGALQWQDLASVMAECADASALPPIERTLARNCSGWLEAAGIKPL